MANFIEIINSEDPSNCKAPTLSYNLYPLNRINRVLMISGHNMIRYYVDGLCDSDHYLSEYFDTEEECRRRYAEVRKILCKE